MRRLDEYKVCPEVKDYRVWRIAKNGSFSTKSFYKGLDHRILSSYSLMGI